MFIWWTVVGILLVFNTVTPITQPNILVLGDWSDNLVRRNHIEDNDAKMYKKLIMLSSQSVTAIILSLRCCRRLHTHPL